MLCMQKTSDGVYHILDMSQCIENNKPATKETCRQDECETMWYMTDWSKVKNIHRRRDKVPIG